MKLTHDLTEKFSVLLNSSEPICHILCFTSDDSIVAVHGDQCLLYSQLGVRSLHRLHFFPRTSKGGVGLESLKAGVVNYTIRNIASALRISTFVPRKIFSNSSRGFEQKIALFFEVNYRTRVVCPL
jgi:hypothetical protein